MSIPLDAGSLHLADRLATLEAERRELEGLLASVQQQGAHLPRRDELDLVRLRLDAAVGKRVDPLRQRLELLQPPVKRSTADRWRELDEIAEQLDGLATELLPVAYGALARAAGVDHGVCSLAEELVGTLGRLMMVNGERVVVPAPRDHTTSGMWAIRLAVRHEGLWSLPIVAHEFSHVIAVDLKDQYDQPRAKSLLEGSWRSEPCLPANVARTPGPLPYNRASELFADILAAHCMGPSYGAALMARAVPVDAWKVRGDHPAHAARLRAVFRVLDNPMSDWVSEMVRNDWEASLAAAGVADEPPEGLAAAIDVFTDCAVEVLDLTASSARFDVSDVLREMGHGLGTGEPPGADTDLRTVVNAAWAERVRAPDRSATIEKAVRTWIVNRRLPHPDEQ